MVAGGDQQQEDHQAERQRDAEQHLAVRRMIVDLFEDLAGEAPFDLPGLQRLAGLLGDPRGDRGDHREQRHRPVQPSTEPGQRDVREGEQHQQRHEHHDGVHDQYV
ncbi:hypothetical protein GCM10029963_39670 [Micromonospora andamanensis]